MLILLLAGATPAAAAEVCIIVTALPSNTPDGETIYIAGNFNGWNPGHTDFSLTNNEAGQPEITLEGTGRIEFKFTRGSWATVEGGQNGGFRPNRTFDFGSADTLKVQILSWEDTGGTNSTATANVSMMNNAFVMPQFGSRTRSIRLYLPPDYETSEERYPVLYMHDGQNLFDQATAFAGEWEVDETLNKLHQEGRKVPIVVGIDNGSNHRIAEYTPWANQGYGGGDGDLYAEFIVETLKPYIDEHYRTLPEREHTAVMGSSLGGLISFYIAHKYQDIFGMAGVFSPSFWFSDSVYTFTRITGKVADVKYYLMGGTSESATMVPLMQAMMDTLTAIGVNPNHMHLRTVPGGQHNEALWRSQFRDAYEWLFSPGDVSAPGNASGSLPIMIQQSGHRIRIEQQQGAEAASAMTINLYNLKGQKTFHAQIMPDVWVDLPARLQGIYIARVVGPGMVYSRKLMLMQ